MIEKYGVDFLKKIAQRYSKAVGFCVKVCLLEIRICDEDLLVLNIKCLNYGAKIIEPNKAYKLQSLLA